MSQSGTVKFFNMSKGYGFVEPDVGCKDLFLHISSLQASGLHGLDEGDKVTFESEDDPKGRGKQVSRIQRAD